jgi:hypothetical protein
MLGQDSILPKGPPNFRGGVSGALPPERLSSPLSELIG